MRNNKKCRPGMDCSGVGKQKVKQSGTRYQKKARKAQGKAKQDYKDSQPVFTPMPKFANYKAGGAMRKTLLTMMYGGSTKKN